MKLFMVDDPKVGEGTFIFIQAESEPEARKEFLEGFNEDVVDDFKGVNIVEIPTLEEFIARMPSTVFSINENADF